MTQQLSPYEIRPAARRDENHINQIEDAEYVVVEATAIDLAYYWKCLRKRLWLMVAIPASIALLVALRDVMATPLYTAQSTILIKNSAPRVFNEGSIQASADDSQSDDPDVVLNTQYQLLKSRSLAAKVIAAEDLAARPMFGGGAAATSAPAAVPSFSLTKWFKGLISGLGGKSTSTDPGEKAQPPPESDPETGTVAPGLVGAYLGALHVTPIENTELVTVTFTTPYPKLSAELANAHVREFINQGVDLNSQNSVEAERFLKSKLGDVKTQVEESEVALNNYRRDKGIIPGLISVNGKEDVILGRLDKLSQDLEEAHLKSLTVGSQVEMIKHGEVDALPGVIDSPVIQKLKSQLDEDQSQYAGMQGDYTTNYPPMAALQAQMRGIREAMHSEEQGVAEGLKEQYASALESEMNLGDELKRQKDFALGLNDAAVRYAILERDADTNRQLYDAILKRMKDVEVTADLHTSNVSIVDHAVPPQSPSSPDKRRDVLTAVVLGLMASIGLVFLLEYFDHTLKDSAEVRSYLGLPTLSVVPDFDRISLPTYGAKAVTGPPSAPGLPAPMYGKEVILSLGTYSVAGEAYRRLRTALQLSRAGTPPKSVLITSTVPHEGKSVTAVNTAIMLALAGKRVLLVDADLRRPRCHELLWVDNRFGLTEVVTGVRALDELIRPTEVDGLSFLSSGELAPNPSELLGSEKMREVLAELEGRYDHVVIDSAPIIPASDPVVLSTLVEGVVLVIGNSVPKQQVKEAIARLRFAHAHVLGAVLNQVDLKAAGYHYYAPHYGYGEDDSISQA